MVKKKKVYRVEGKLKQKNKNQPFVKDIIEISENQAKDRIYKDMGSKHKIKRHMIEITKISEIKPKDSKSLYVQQAMKGE